MKKNVVVWVALLENQRQKERTGDDSEGKIMKCDIKQNECVNILAINFSSL